ncbi:restriction endonuclease [Halorarum halophilum]|uniref:Restriction endonuclease n=1 Tax=Halorarum halophilum TaxID=2743090 RepID=A0A7D5KLJ0_9EURY|nr:restriction endonuclease [Halobaculum halophilum]QLG26862.1 restriction endonuclease [Halobaculum halophilum]
MKEAAAKDYIRDQYLGITPTQFEQLSKLVLERSERTRELELTPFRQDGGIDVHAVIERDLFWARLGVQVKQYQESSNIGLSGIQRFKGALFDVDYQIGTYITSSGYTDSAIESAEQSYLRLIDGERLAEIMLNSEIGVEYVDSSTYHEDIEFWEAFEKPEEEGIIPTSEVPQADHLHIIRTTLEAVDRGYTIVPEIKSYLDTNAESSYVERQGLYYPDAAWMLGLLHKGFQKKVNGQKKREFGLTRRGEEYLELVEVGQDEAAKEVLCEAIRGVEMIERITAEIREEGVITHTELKEIIDRESAVTGTTITRRATTCGKWIDYLPEYQKRTTGGPQRYEYVGDGLGNWS